MTRRSIVGGIVGIVALVGVGLVTIVGGADSGVLSPGHQSTALDASSSTTPPLDWHSGYARTGTICYPQDATGITAACFAANALPYTVDATDTGWPIEPSQINRFPYNSAASCDGTPFVCSTATMDSTTVAPDSTTTAYTFAMGGGSADATAVGYANSTLLDLRMYAKCPNGTLDASNIGGEGHWTVDGTALGAGWQLLYTGHSQVTEVQAWKSNGSGVVRLRLSGLDCSIWQITATEVLGYVRSTRLLGTIPTSDATGSTVGASVWSIVNDHGAYWAASGVAKSETLTTHSGTCWSYSGTTIKLSGSSTCHGIWYALGLTWSY